MSRRSKIVIAVIILLALIAFAVWLLLSRRGVPLMPNVNDPLAANQVVNALGGSLNSSTTVNINTAPVANVNAQMPPPPPDPLLALKRTAMSFAERYGSFSSLGDYENQVDLKVFMSDAFANRTDAYVAAQRAKPLQAAYRGFTTRALSVEVQSLDDTAGNAVLIVKTQRQEFTSASVEGKVTYQDIRLGFVKESDSWKVDTAVWQ